MTGNSEALSEVNLCPLLACQLFGYAKVRCLVGLQTSLELLHDILGKPKVCPDGFQQELYLNGLIFSHALHFRVQIALRAALLVQHRL